MVQYEDGAVIAQLGTPDMKLPIQYALFYPERTHLAGPRLDFWEMGRIELEKPDTERFPGLALAYRAAEAGGSMPTVFNAANEAAVRRFLREEISYTDIPEMIRRAMDAHEREGVLKDPSVEEILSLERDISRMTKDSSPACGTCAPRAGCR